MRTRLPWFPPRLIETVPHRFTVFGKSNIIKPADYQQEISKLINFPVVYEQADEGGPAWAAFWN